MNAIKEESLISDRALSAVGIRRGNQNLSLNFIFSCNGVSYGASVLHGNPSTVYIALTTEFFTKIDEEKALEAGKTNSLMAIVTEMALTQHVAQEVIDNYRRQHAMMDTELTSEFVTWSQRSDTHPQFSIVALKVIVRSKEDLKHLVAVAKLVSEKIQGEKMKERMKGLNQSFETAFRMSTKAITL